MHQLTVCVTYSSIEIQLSMIKKFLLTKFEKKLQKKKNLRKGNKIFWVGPVLGG